MTVFELVELLKQFDPDADVFVQGLNYEDEGLTTPQASVWSDGFIVIE